MNFFFKTNTPYCLRIFSLFECRKNLNEAPTLPLSLFALLLIVTFKINFNLQCTPFLHFSLFLSEFDLPNTNPQNIKSNKCYKKSIWRCFILLDGHKFSNKKTDCVQQRILQVGVSKSLHQSCLIGIQSWNQNSRLSDPWRRFHEFQMRKLLQGPGNQTLVFIQGESARAVHQSSTRSF